MYISKQRDISQPNRKYILYPSLIQFSLAPIFPASLSVHLVIITCQTNPIKSLSQQDKSSPASSPLLQSCLVSAQQRRKEWSTHCWTDILVAFVDLNMILRRTAGSGNPLECAQSA